MCIILDWTAGPIEAKLSGSIEEIASLAHYAAYQQHNITLRISSTKKTIITTT